MALVYVECGEGGVQATWHVSVLSWFGFICSAVVVDHSWVLTAAHCIDQHTYVRATHAVTTHAGYSVIGTAVN